MNEEPHSKRRRQGRPTVQIMLSDDERQTLQRWARRGSSSQALALRCRIVLACAEGLSNVAVGEHLGVHPVTVAKWRGRFATRRLEGLADEPRPGVPRTITDEQVEQVIVTTLEEAPADATHWSTRSLARATGMSQTAVSRIWRAFGLKPHLAETWKLSTAPVLPLMPGSPQRRSHDSTRHGTTNLYAALNLASGLVISQMTPRHRAIEFKRFLARIDQAVPAELDVHLIVDNSSTHKTPVIRRWLLAHPRFHVHFTPTYSSWLNLVERWFAELTTKWLRRGTHRSTKELVASIRTWIEGWNDEPRPFVWHKTADQILENLAAYCERISDSAH